MPYSTIQQRQFPILHLSCAACAASAESILQYQEGVVKVAVNFASMTAWIEYDSALTNSQKLQKALQKVGYDLIIAEENAQEQAQQQRQTALKALQQKTLWAMSLAMPTMLIGMLFMQYHFTPYLMALLTTPVLYFGKDFFVRAYKQALQRKANMDTLVALSTGIAYSFSLWHLAAPHLWQTNPHIHHDYMYFESAAVIIAFILLGKWLEEKAKAQTHNALQKLIGLQPKSVSLKQADGTWKETPIAQIQTQDIILVKAGEKIAVDGVIVQGSSWVEESMLTGEYLPIAKQIGDKVWAGTLNQQGSFEMKALKIGKDTLLASIMHLVQKAQGSKMQVQNLTDKIAQYFVPTILIIALLTFVAWQIYAPHTFPQGLLAAITVLVIACPCALGLATPTAVMVGIGKGAEFGILIKDATGIEKMPQINTIILDKTGTITEGKPQIKAVFWQEQMNVAQKQEAEVLLQHITHKSEHPLAQAIAQFLVTKNDKKALNSPIVFENIAGKGIQATYQNQTFYVGSANLLADKNIPISPELQNAQAQFAFNCTWVWFANQTEALACIALADTIKPNAQQAVAHLQKQGLQVIMLTGDNEAVAKEVAQQVGIRHYQAQAQPAEKLALVQKLQNEGKKVAMVGDGINDSAALAQADVSIAINKGADVAIEIAQLTLMSDNLLKIPQSIQLGRKISRTIYQNLFWAFAYNIVCIPVAAGVLYASHNIMLNPMIASAAMALSSVSVVLNSLLLKLIRFK